MPRVGFIPIALVIGMLAACSTTIERVSDPKELQGLGFLRDTRVTRQEVEGRMGWPGANYEDGRVVTYRLGKKDGQFTRVGAELEYTLVLVYRSDDTVGRWGLVHRSHPK